MTPTRKQQKKPKSGDQGFTGAEIEDMQDNWYTAGVAAEHLTANSGIEVDASYVNKLGQLGKIRMKKIHARLVLYNAADVDNYKVERKGVKSGKASSARKTLS